MAVELPETVATRAALLWLVHNLTDEKLAEGFEFVSHLWADQKTIDPWDQSAVATKVVLCAGPALREVAEPNFFEE